MRTFSIRLLAGKVDRRAGSHSYHLELVRRLAARGHRVSLICFAPTPQGLDCAELFPIPDPPPAKPLLWRFQSVFSARHYARALSRLPLMDVDAVIGGEHLLLRPHRRSFPRTPWLYVPHSLLIDQEIRSYNFPPTMNRISTWTYVRLQRWALTDATRTLRFTWAACKALEARYRPKVPPRFVVSAPGATMGVALEHEPRPGPVRLLWMGQLIPRKRLDLALRCLAGMKHLDWTFDIVGDGASREALEQQARDTGLSDRVRFHGFQREPHAWYRRADLVVFPSWLENFPLTMIEAMACGVPCLAFRGDGERYHNAHGEIIEHGRDGFLADSDHGFRHELARLVEAPTLLADAGMRAKETVGRRFSWERHIDRLEQLFGELCPL